MTDKEVVSLNDYMTNNKNQKKTNKSKKGFIITITALVVSMAIAISALLASVTSRNKNKNKHPDTANTTSTSLTVNDLGADLGYNPTKDNNKNTYSNPTGSVVIENIVENEDGKKYANQEALDNASNVGTVVDTQNGNLEVKEDGKVIEKNEGYEIETSSGVVSGEIEEDNKVNDYVWDSVLGTYVKPEELGKYVKDETGKLWLKTDYEEYLKLQGKENTSSNVDVKEEIKTEVDTVVEGVINEDGTYTIGEGEESITFMSKDDFDQWVLQGFTGYGIDVKTGMMVPENQISTGYQKVK